MATYSSQVGDANKNKAVNIKTAKDVTEKCNAVFRKNHINAKAEFIEPQAGTTSEYTVKISYDSSKITSTNIKTILFAAQQTIGGTDRVPKEKPEEKYSK